MDWSARGVRRAAGDLFALSVGRLGGLFLNLVFLPLYDAMLGPELFGAVAMLLSLQAFFLMFDFGLSSLLGCEAAQAAKNSAERAELAADWRLIENILPATGMIAGTVAALLWSTIPSQGRIVSALDVLLVAFMMVGMIQLNAGQAVLNASSHYRFGSALLLAGAMGRGVAAVAAVQVFGPGFTPFVASQLAVVVAQQRVQAWRLYDILGPAGPRRGRLCLLLNRLKPLMAYGLAGALLMQVDKPLVGHFFSLQAAGRWFLAMTYALTPVALLAGPLYQYFFPRLAAALGQSADAVETARLFQLATVLATAVPSAVLAWHAPLLVSIWLPHAADTADIAALARPMVVAAAVGAMGYLPTAYLIASGDRGWLAQMSWTMLACVVAALLAAASNRSLLSLALVYSLYHVVSCLLLWMRMLKTFPDSDNRCALVRNAWLLPMITSFVPILSLLLLLELVGVTALTSLYTALAFGALTVGLVATVWWLRYCRTSFSSNTPKQLK